MFYIHVAPTMRYNMKKILTESERLQRNAYMRKYYADHKGKPKSGRVVSQYPSTDTDGRE